MNEAHPRKGPLRVLLVEDDEADAFLVGRRLEREGLAPAIERVFTAVAMQEALARSGFDVVLSDFSMPGFDALQALAVLRASGKDLPFIVVSGTIGEDIAVQAMKAGAHDYFSKNALDRLASAIDREMREAHMRRERREALASRREAEERLRLVLDSVKEYAIYTLDLQGRVSSWHPGAERVYGYAEAEVLGHAFSRFFHPDEVVEGKPDRILAAARSDGAYQGELTQTSRDGALFWADCTVAPMRDDERRLRGFSVVTRDVTDQVKLLEELRVAVRSRDEFLSMASHELRTPVTSLQLQLDTLRRLAGRIQGGIPAPVLERIHNLDRQTGRIARLVSELLDLSRMRLGKFELSVEELDLAEVLRETVERLGDQAERARCPLSLRVQAPAPGRWDRLRIEQVVTNLIVNALKFGSEKPVVVTLDGDDEHAWITVEDHGIGIAPEDQARVFGQFERAAPAENYSGLGLGLFIAREIVEAHGGNISLRSTPGEGTLFTVTLPRAAQDEDAPGRAAAAGGTGGGSRA